jgi:V8-like Glu-specific endopeptidase
VRYLSSILILILLSAANAKAQTTARLDFPDGTCSGTIVAPNTILSAGHCFQGTENEWGIPEPAPTEMKVDGYKVKILATVFDDNDHALVKVDFTFHDHAKLSKPATVGTRIHYWGNPAGLNNIYRSGYVTSYHNSAMMMDVNGFFGDSGSGIFNDAGEVVGVMGFLSVHPHDGLKFTLMGAATPLEFTPLQYDMMGVTPP